MWSKACTVFPGASYDSSTHLETVCGFGENLFIHDSLLLGGESPNITLLGKGL